MNREIEFRGKRLDDGQWLYGDLIRDNHQGYYVFPIDCNGLCTANKVAPDTVGEFTGMTDKNGKKIFEGDIIYSEFSDKSNCHCLVGWNDEEACFGLMNEYNFRAKQEGYDFPKFDSLVLLNFRSHAMKFEVIGNIYDNPELLSAK